MPPISPRAQRLVICAAFNLLFEYSLRGRAFVYSPILPLILFGVYVSYFSMLDDLIRRFRLRNSEVLAIAFLYSLVITVFVTGTVFRGTLVAGINIVTLLVEGILWWGVLQGILTFYLAGRLKPRDWVGHPMGRRGWSVAVAYTVAFIWLASRNPLLRHGSATGYVVILVLVVVTCSWIIVRLKRVRPAPWSFSASPLLDALVGGLIGLFIVVGSWPVQTRGIVAAAYINTGAVKIIVGWTVLCSIGYGVYRWSCGKDVTL